MAMYIIMRRELQWLHVIYETAACVEKKVFEKYITSKVSFFYVQCKRLMWRPHNTHIK